MQIQIIELGPHDDHTSVCDRLAALSAERVLLVWPAQDVILRRKLDLVLIERQAARSHARLALVSHDLQVIDHATDLNISVFASVPEGTAGRWKVPRTRIYGDQPPPPRAMPDRVAIQSAPRRLRPATMRIGRVNRGARAIALLALTITMLVFLYLIGPYAHVQVFLARDQLSATVRLTADPTIAAENLAIGHIPATLISNLIVERQGTAQASGSADVPATIASGTAILSNQTPDPVAVPLGTVVATLGARPVRFRTLQDVVINGYGSAELTITALQDSAGPIGNIEANLINRVEGTLSGKLAVRNPRATQGGTVRQQGIVTAEDQARLLALVRDNIRASAVGDIRLTPTQFIAPGSIQIVEERPEWTTFGNFVGDQSNTLTLTLKVRIQALVIDELLARKAAYAALASKLVDRQIVVESISYQRGKVDPVDAKGMAGFAMTVSGDAVTAASAEKLRARITGLSVADARAALDRETLLDPRRPPQIDVSPVFLGRLPLLGVRIDVEVR